MTLSDSGQSRRPEAPLRPLPSPGTGLPDYPHHPSDVPCPRPRRIERVRVSIVSPLTRPSPNGRRSASALSLSRPAQASLTLRPAGLLSRPRRPLSRGSSPSGCPAEPLVSYQINRQLSGESSSTGDPRLQGALPFADISGRNRADQHVPRTDSLGRSPRAGQIYASGDVYQDGGDQADRPGFGAIRWGRAERHVR